MVSQFTLGGREHSRALGHLRKTVRSLQSLLPVYSWQLQGQVPGFPWCISMGTAQQPCAGRCTPSISMAPITMAPTCSEKTLLKTEHKKEGGQSASPEPPSPAAAVIPVIALTGLSSSRFWFCCLCFQACQAHTLCISTWLLWQRSRRSPLPRRTQAKRLFWEEVGSEEEEL